MKIALVPILLKDFSYHFVECCLIFQYNIEMYIPDFLRSILSVNPMTAENNM